MSSRWYLYCVTCRDGSLYTGITTDLARRLRAHNRGTGGAYTRSRRPVALAYLESRPTRAAALRRERAIKQWPRQQKLALISGGSDA